MWSLLVLFFFTISWAAAQNGRGNQPQEHNGHGWDIRLAVPGEPGSDYPTLGAIPRTSFSCAGREPGYYADVEANCQVFRVCTVGSTYGFQSFLCPNGTLFNQAVFVCDWWMNVDCKNSEQYIKTSTDKFENLRLGPQLMKDIKKMLTHPMLNPYDKKAMKSNLVVMQEYKPPFGQLFPNGALIAGPERPPNNVYIPSKQIQQNLIQGNDYPYSASTPDPRYLPAPLNINYLPSQTDSDIFQRQRQNGQYIQTSNRIQTGQNLQSGNLVSNSHAGASAQNTNTANNNVYRQNPRPTQISNISQKQTNTIETPKSVNSQNNQREQRGQYSESRKASQFSNGKQTDLGVSFTKPLNNQNINTKAEKQSYTYNNPTSNLPQFSMNLDHPVGRELKQNLVSTNKDVPSTVITRTVSYSKVVHAPKVSKPKSRVTFKTWIVKPTKSARLIAEPTAYTYSRPSPPSPLPTERLVQDNTPYVYPTPSPSPQTERIISTEPNSVEAYVYTRPTESARQIRTTEIATTRIFVPPTTIPTRPTYSSRLNFQSSPIPTKSSRLYLTPAPFTSTARYYLPPSQNITPYPRLYLPPNDILQQSFFYQNAQLRASPTIPPTTAVSFSANTNQPTSSLSHQSRLNTNYRNLSFADILTKEKLDITVNDIVKDTDNILKTASPPQYDQFRTDYKITEFTRDNYFTKATTDSGENLTSQPPTQSTTMPVKSARLISTPARSLEPPTESYIYQNTNQISNLPFYKESAYPNTIERTVSIKITIPERIATYLFKNRSDSDYDKLEILNTGSSNYLVLSNNLLPKKNNDFIPIAKLIGDKNTNISDSQALVYSFLTDSLNVVREYNNIAKQEILSSPATPTPTPAQFQNLNNEQLSQITNKISQLTSSQYSNNNIFSNGNTKANLVSAPTTNNTSESNRLRSNSHYTNEQSQPRQIQSSQYNIVPSQQTQNQLYSSRLQRPNEIQQNPYNLNQVYSGQLYQWSVPEVTTQIYNRQQSANLVNPNNIPQHQKTQTLDENQNNAMNNLNQGNSNFEIIKAETIPLNPVKVPSNDPESTNSQETLNLLNGQHGISAQLQDKIVGTIPHPLEENKLLTYEKDQSYYLFANVEENTIDQDTPANQQVPNNNYEIQKSAKLVQTTETPKQSSFQLIPSVSYELEDEKEQQQFLDAFRIDEFGAPRELIKPKGEVESSSQRQILTSSVDFSVEHPTTPKQSDQYKMNLLYSGPSSYTAPQSSVGSLENSQGSQNNLNSRLEDFESSNGNENGYPRERPARQFLFK